MHAPPIRIQNQNEPSERQCTPNDELQKIAKKQTQINYGKPNRIASLMLCDSVGDCQLGWVWLGTRVDLLGFSAWLGLAWLGLVQQGLIHWAWLGLAGLGLAGLGLAGLGFGELSGANYEGG